MDRTRSDPFRPELMACRFAGFTLVPGRGALLRPDGSEAGLRPKTAELLRHLAGRAGRVVSREELLDAVWPGVFVSDDSITQCVIEIRRALGEAGASLLRTLPKRGYLLAAEVTPVEVPAMVATAASEGTVAAPPARPEAGEASASGPGPPAPEARDERKQATPLALSFVPGLGTPTDPEDLEPLLEDAARRGASAARGHGGLVLRAATEGVLAVFGVPHALEDHALRACRAALEVVGEGGAILVCAALDSGEVLLHGGGAAVFGACLQRAARIAAAAVSAPGITLATDAIATLTRGRMRFAATEAMPLDPAAPALPLCRLEGPTPPGQNPGAAAPGFIEREAELVALAAALVPVEQGQGRVVAVIGEAGVGKSRLVREFVAGALPQGWRVIAAGADPHATDLPYAAVAGLLRSYFGVTEGDGAEAVRRRVGAAGWAPCRSRASPRPWWRRCSRCWARRSLDRPGRRSNRRSAAVG